MKKYYIILMLFVSSMIANQRIINLTPEQYEALRVKEFVAMTAIERIERAKMTAHRMIQLLTNDFGEEVFSQEVVFKHEKPFLKIQCKKLGKKVFTTIEQGPAGALFYFVGAVSLSQQKRVRLAAKK